LKLSLSELSDLNIALPLRLSIVVLRITDACEVAYRLRLFSSDALRSVKRNGYPLITN
jgi:hypothetical protein